MRSLLSFLFAFAGLYFFPACLWGQFEIIPVDFGFSDAVLSIEEGPDNQVVIINNGLGHALSQNSITAFSNDGNQVFNYQIESPITGVPLNGKGNINDIIFQPNGDATFIQSLRSLNDCVDGHQKLVIFNSQWQEQSSSNISIPLLTAETAKFGGIMEDDFILFENSIILRLKADGQTLWQNGYMGGFGEPVFFTDILVLNQDSLLAATQFGLWIIDGTGGLINTIQFEHIQGIYQLELLNDEKILALENHWNWGMEEPDSLILFSPELEQLHKIGFPEEDILGLTILDEKAAVLTEGQHVYVLDFDLNIISDFLFDDVANYQHIALTDDGVILAGQAQFGLDVPRKGNLAPILKKFDFMGNTQTQVTDAGMINIEQASQPYSNQSTHYTVFFKDLIFTVQNHGMDTLRNVRVNLEFPQIDTACTHGHQRFYKNFQNLLIPPGGVEELEWDEISVTFDDDPTGLKPFCAWTSQPNLKADVNPENDLYCYDFLVATEKTFGEKKLSISPNPTGDKLTIEIQRPYSNEETTILICNGQGIRFFKKNIPNKAHEFTISTYDWPVGIYFFQYIENGKMRGSERIIVNR